jgi:altronate hydrolase
MHKYLKVHPDDNVLVALSNLNAGDKIEQLTLSENIPAKHKFTIHPLTAGDPVIMYGVLVGKATMDIPSGGLLSVKNIHHATHDFGIGKRKTEWNIPDTSAFRNRSFMGYQRSDGKTGTANYWLVIPLVFCENRNIQVLKDALLKDLGYAAPNSYQTQTRELIQQLRTGKTAEDILNYNAAFTETLISTERIFPNVDGIKFLEHDGGCGGTREDSDALCGLLAGYIVHPNVAGVTVLSLGCQHAQAGILEKEIHKRDPHFSKPIFILEQQKIGKESILMEMALKQTFAGVMMANEFYRSEAPLSSLCIGLECGGSDGFSGISANPAIGYTSDLLVALGGSVILSEFPELCGVEQQLSDRCIDHSTAEKFIHLMKRYNERAMAVGSGFDMNPSPGNIRDGLITDAIKSAGAAKKGGSSPVTDVLDYPNVYTKKGLNLLCTPGNDVESTTAEVGSGANIVLFTTGLGTPTGNPIVPVIKISSNTSLYHRMPDIIDINTGSIIEGTETIEGAGERIMDYVIGVASGETMVSAVKNGQDDFIPWKRGVSL